MKKKIIDRYGRELEPFDVVKVFHFVGTRRKKYFMYKWALEERGNLVGAHLDENPARRNFDWESCDPENLEIVQSNNFEKLEKPKLKKGKERPYVQS